MPRPARAKAGARASPYPTSGMYGSDYGAGGYGSYGGYGSTGSYGASTAGYGSGGPYAGYGAAARAAFGGPATMASQYPAYGGSASYGGKGSGASYGAATAGYTPAFNSYFRAPGAAGTAGAAKTGGSKVDKAMEALKSLQKQRAKELFTQLETTDMPYAELLDKAFSDATGKVVKLGMTRQRCADALRTIVATPPTEQSTEAETTFAALNDPQLTELKDQLTVTPYHQAIDACMLITELEKKALKHLGKVKMLESMKLKFGDHVTFAPPTNPQGTTASGEKQNVYEKLAAMNEAEVVSLQTVLSITSNLREAVMMLEGQPDVPKGVVDLMKTEKLSRAGLVKWFAKEKSIDIPTTEQVAADKVQDLLQGMALDGWYKLQRDLVTGTFTAAIENVEADQSMKDELKKCGVAPVVSALSVLLDQPVITASDYICLLFTHLHPNKKQEWRGKLVAMTFEEAVLQLEGIDDRGKAIMLAIGPLAVQKMLERFYQTPIDLKNHPSKMKAHVSKGGKGGYQPYGYRTA